MEKKLGFRPRVVHYFGGRARLAAVAAAVVLAFAPCASVAATAKLPQAASIPSSPALTNSDVVGMVGAGLSQEIVIAKIKASACDFDTSPAALEQLKAQRVPDAVILAMVQAPHATSRGATKTGASPTSGGTARMSTTVGDLGAVSGPIAKNEEELKELLQQKKREILEFSVANNGFFGPVGPIQIRVDTIAPDSYTLTLKVDDKLIVKRDKTLYQPLQFYVATAKSPYEIVVFKLDPDKVVGYLSMPTGTLQSSSNAAGNLQSPPLMTPAVTGDVDTSAPTSVSGSPKTTHSGLQYWDIVQGTRAEAVNGSQVTVHYTDWLTNGKKIDSGVDRGQPLSFVLGAGQMIKGFDEGVAGMKQGGKRGLG